ncbi:endonuclease iii [Stylonychia lemnae]|uniref:Endonuclease III homolog n=1 Tax=Stylonychia lemnae TaxID=5949 RepID=A0A078A638_STYLE|nr:endonuclease iii [Stylonychia lemnae]|eukprot:CDW77361.1 endonuclease iii [Stylonychia lemnae]
MKRTLTRKTIKIEYEEEEKNQSPIKPVSNLKLSRSLKVTKTRQDMSFVPKNWQKLWDVIQVMRSENEAPVDSMGSSLLADPKAEKNEQSFQTLVGLMLSSQTKDEVTSEAVFTLREHGLSIKMINEIEEQKLNELIKKVGFHNKKAKYLKDAAAMIIKDFKGKVPSDLEEILKLPGVGLKMAHLLLQQCFDKKIGISVDTHVHRISNRLKWVPKETKNPEETAKALQDWLPVEKWADINFMLVGFGQTICRPLAPKCYICKASTLCPYNAKTKEPTKSKKRQTTEEQKQDDNDMDDAAAAAEAKEETKIIERAGKESKSKDIKKMENNLQIRETRSKSKQKVGIIMRENNDLTIEQVNLQQLESLKIKASKKRKMADLDNYKFVDKTNIKMRKKSQF